MSTTTPEETVIAAMLARMEAVQTSITSLGKPYSEFLWVYPNMDAGAISKNHVKVYDAVCTSSRIGHGQTKVYRGYMQANIFVQRSVGALLPVRMADRIIERFPINAEYSGVRIYETKTGIKDIEELWYKVPVFIHYRFVN